MRLDSLVRAIESSDFSAFREIALHALIDRGFTDIELTDGPSDGGRDFRTGVLQGGSLRIGIQISVTKTWKAKLEEDIEKIHRIYGFEDVLYLSSRRIPEAEFESFSDKMLRTYSVRVQKMDCQGIASRAISNGFAGKILKALGIPYPDDIKRNLSKTSLRQEVAYAYSFFGHDVSRFRTSVVEQLITAALFNFRVKTGRGKLVDKCAEVLGLSDNQRHQVESSIDRMLQDGRLTMTPKDFLELRSDLADAHQAASAMLQSDWNTLKKSVRLCIAEHGNACSLDDNHIEALINLLGALAMTAGECSAKGLENTMSHDELQGQLQKRLRKLGLLLDEMSILSDTDRDEVMEKLTSLATSSAVGKQLIAGEVFIALASMQTPTLLKALGNREKLTVLLDSSVSIPMLASLLYEPTGRHHSLAAYRTFQQIEAHNIDAHVPWDYLEETAAHMLDAYHSYGAIVDIVPELKASENAYVSHYVTLKLRGRLDGQSFVQYLQGFGFSESRARGDYYAARDDLMKRLASLFERYHIKAKKMGNPSRRSEKRAEEILRAVEKKRNIRRQQVIIKHDARTIGYLLDNELAGNEACILCTWDNLHFYIQQEERDQTGAWHIVDPAILSDMLGLAASEEIPDFVGPSVIAMALTDAAAEEASAVWDALVQLEKGNLFDAQMLQQARDFKSSYLAKRNIRPTRNCVKAAWESWKSDHQLTNLPERVNPDSPS